MRGILDKYVPVANWISSGTFLENEHRHFRYTWNTYVYTDVKFAFYEYISFFFYHLYCLVGCLSMIVWTHAVLGVLYACVLYFCICICSAQLSMFYMESRSRNTTIIIIIIFIIIIIIIFNITVSLWHWTKVHVILNSVHNEWCCWGDLTQQIWKLAIKEFLLLIGLNKVKVTENNLKVSWHVRDLRCLWDSQTWLAASTDLYGMHHHLHHLGFVHPLQDVALHQCLPSSSVCCFPNPGGSLLLCYVILPSSARSSSRPLPSLWLPLCASPCPPIVL